MREKQNIATNLLLLFCTIALFIETVEVGARVYYYGWDILRPSLGRSIPYLGNPNISQPSSIGLSVELKPNIRTRFRKVILETNSQGLRDKEYEIKKPDNTFRVAVLGDSFTMPSGVAIEDAYHTLLEDRYNAQSYTLDYEFINFGVDGYSLKDYLLQLQHVVPPYEPDLILVGFMPGNDTQEVLPANVEKLVPASNFWAYILAVILHGKDAIHPQVHNTWSTAVAKGISPNPLDKMIRSNEPYLRKMFAQIAAETTEKGMPVLVANMEYKTVHPLLLTLLREITEEHGMSFVDTSVHFEGMDKSSLMIYRADGHTNAKANRIFADVIYEELQRSNLIPSDTHIPQ
ncbi:hypothetical protein COU78_01830 [Candidatus Peregrinibacteria bacterium CG10_big_fil_rev_8_21_14_0_10_49_24]|nr:MAG: hypothetical protein COU78_01830 [Candidatus Peregrinibacteria bacterium CG10_big_fil_rev_8_21_14_0_10_49_24]PJA67412.1 MAG: hypothetical protein CO157_04680 [Candidatus Peregrinibacteria bacterium CG_4_9_14_3_um_filter_49_12]